MSFKWSYPIQPWSEKVTFHPPNSQGHVSTQLQPFIEQLHSCSTHLQPSPAHLHPCRLTCTHVHFHRDTCIRNTSTARPGTVVVATSLCCCKPHCSTAPEYTLTHTRLLCSQADYPLWQSTHGHPYALHAFAHGTRYTIHCTLYTVHCTRYREPLNYMHLFTWISTVLF